MIHPVANRASSGWISSMNKLGVYDVAEEFYLERGGQGTLFPCPRCGAYSCDDGTGVVKVSLDDSRWRCVDCAAGGDPLALAAFKVLEKRQPAGGEEWQRLRVACEELKLIGADSECRKYSRLPLRLETLRWTLLVVRTLRTSNRVSMSQLTDLPARRVEEILAGREHPTFDERRRLSEVSGIADAELVFTGTKHAGWNYESPFD